MKFSQYTKLILKVSYNRGADLMACLAAVRVHSTNCLDGVAAEVKTAVGLGVSRTGVFPAGRPPARTIKGARRPQHWPRC